MVIIVISALLVRYFSGSETLSEYAKKNPSSKPSTEDTTSVDDGTESDEEPINKIEEEIIPEDRVTYKDGFYYQSLTESVIERITGCSYPVLEDGDSIEIGYDDLSYVVVQYLFV